MALNFKKTNFVLEPGDFSIRGFIVDIFSYSQEIPYRMVLDNEKVEELTCFQVNSQISIKKLNNINIVSNSESRDLFV